MKPAWRAPFPWFGGKRRVASLVWERFGNVQNYVEPFAGSLAVLLDRPHDPRIETVNDLDCMIANFWRSLQNDPEAVASFADWPINEADLHARHEWIHARATAEWQERMHSDAEFYDAEIAGWWVWGISCWIGDNWCAVEKNMSKPHLLGAKGIHADRRRPDLLNAKGLHALTKDGTGRDHRRPHLSGTQGIHTSRQAPSLRGDSGASGSGVHRSTLSRKRPQMTSHGGHGIHRKSENLLAYMNSLSERLRNVRVCCGEWHRVLGPTPTIHCGTTAVFLDPPYGDGCRDKVYNHDSLTLADDVRAWCMLNADHKKLRIALCGYEGEHDELESAGWDVLAWRANGGYGNRATRGNANRTRERIWFSPNCLQPDAALQTALFQESESDDAN